MTDDLLTVVRPPCVNRCIRRGTEDDLLPATHGRYCSRCWGKVVSALRIAPELIEHVQSMLTVTGAHDDKVSVSQSAPLPFSTQAHADANAIYRVLSSWVATFAPMLKLVGPGTAARSWTGRFGVVGLPANIAPGDARAETARLTEWLDSHLAWIFDLGDTFVDDLIAETRLIFIINARWPREEKPRYSEMPCPNDRCRGRIAVYPPRNPGDDRVIRCESCGLTLTDDLYKHYIAMYNQIQAEADPVKRHLMRKYAV